MMKMPGLKDRWKNWSKCSRKLLKKYLKKSVWKQLNGES